MSIRRLLAHAVRLPLRMIPAAAVLPVIRGPLRNARWITGSSTHGAWLGSLERPILERFAARLRPGITVWDVGAHVGLYTLLSARAVGPAGRVVAFEPIPRNVEYLRRHVALNGRENVTLVECAVSDTAGTVRMSGGDSFSEFHIDREGAFTVECITLDRWSSETEATPPAVVKIDVEGAETAVLRGAATVFSTARPTIFLAIHGEEQRRDCAALLSRWGYRVSSSVTGEPGTDDNEWTASPA